MLRRRGAAERQSSPLSWTQLGLWLVHQAAPESAAYHVSFSARITSVVNVDALRASLQGLVDRHAILRTTYLSGDDEPCQVVVGYREADFELIDVAAATDGDLRELVRTTYERPFDLSRDSMMRARLFTRSTDDHILLLVWSHIAVDGWSTWILLDELRRLYRITRIGWSRNASTSCNSIPRVCQMASRSPRGAGRTAPLQLLGGTPNRRSAAQPPGRSDSSCQCPDFGSLAYMAGGRQPLGTPQGHRGNRAGILVRGPVGGFQDAALSIHGPGRFAHRHADVRPKPSGLPRPCRGSGQYRSASNRFVGIDHVS